MRPYFLLLLALEGAHALSNGSPQSATQTATSPSRAAFVKQVIPSFVGAISMITSAESASAAGAPPSPEELARIRKGYDQIQYLLANFESETTVCRENGGQCKRDAEPIRRVLGLRSTTDPLFQIDKVFVKVKNMDIDPDRLEDFFEATEDWNSAMNMSNSMAFISQFGEYNPGGGVEEVLKYLNESKKQVEIAGKALRTIMDCLGMVDT